MSVGRETRKMETALGLVSPSLYPFKQTEALLRSTLRCQETSQFVGRSLKKREEDLRVQESVWRIWMANEKLYEKIERTATVTTKMRLKRMNPSEEDYMKTWRERNQRLAYKIITLQEAWKHISLVHSDRNRCTSEGRIEPADTGDRAIFGKKDASPRDNSENSLWSRGRYLPEARRRRSLRLKNLWPLCRNETVISKNKKWIFIDHSWLHRYPKLTEIPLCKLLQVSYFHASDSDET